MIYVTKHALTHGIEAYKNVDIYHDGVVRVKDGVYYLYFYGKGKEWHTDIKEAHERAEEMRLEKIDSLKKQINKLENSCFALGG